MKWTDRFRDRDDDSDLPEEIRGKTPQQLAESIKASKAALEIAKDEEAKRLTAEAERDTQKTEFEKLKERLAAVEADPRLRQQQQQQADEPATIYSEPERFIDERTRGTQQLALAAGIMSAKMYAMQQLAPRDVKIFRKYEKEVETVVGSYPPAAQVSPQSWMNALIYIKGLHDTDIAKAESTHTDFFAEGSVGTQQRDEPLHTDKLTAEEEATCEAMHWNKEGYLKRKKEMQLSTSEKGTYAKFTVEPSKKSVSAA